MIVDIVTIQDSQLPSNQKLERVRTRATLYGPIATSTNHKLTEAEFVELIAEPLADYIDEHGINTVDELVYKLKELFELNHILRVSEFAIQWDDKILIFEFKGIRIETGGYVYGVTYRTEANEAVDSTPLIDTGTGEIEEYDLNSHCARMEVVEGLFDEYGCSIIQLQESEYYTAKQALLDEYDQFGTTNPGIRHIIITPTYMASTGWQFEVKWAEFRFYVIPMDFEPGGDDDEGFCYVGSQYHLSVWIDSVETDGIQVRDFIQMVRDPEVALVYITEANGYQIYVWERIKVTPFSTCDDNLVVSHSNLINAIRKTIYDTVNDKITIFISK